ncbi:9615_t:CDS:2, partial [Racocetra fulgida]
TVSREKCDLGSMWRVVIDFDQIRNTNLEIQRRRESCINHTPPPSYKEVTDMLNHHNSSNRERE